MMRCRSLTVYYQQIPEFVRCCYSIRHRSFINYGHRSTPARLLEPESYSLNEFWTQTRAFNCRTAANHSKEANIQPKPYSNKTVSDHAENSHHFDDNSSYSAEPVHISTSVGVIPNELEIDPPFISTIDEMNSDSVKLSKHDFLKQWQWLSEYGPGFTVQARNIRVLYSPQEFYSTLLENAQSAKHRVCLASLYLGNGNHEHRLLEALEKNESFSSSLRVKVLLDYTRGSRGDKNSRTMMLPLISKGYSCNMYLFHTPALRGFKKWLPQRWNEIVGLQHMKIYIFDDTVIISGANLSTDYFTNRQDRYLLIENSKELADFYERLVDCVSKFSFKLNIDDSVSLDKEWNIHPSNGSFDSFISSANSLICDFYEESKSLNKSRLESFLHPSSQSGGSGDLKEDTWVFPLIQMGTFHVFHDKDATCRAFEKAPQDSVIKLATGYFNLTSEYINKIIHRSRGTYDILMAHPTANGFFGAKGFAGGIPAAYTLIAKQFYMNAEASNQLHRLSMKEYIRDGWTYHAKGLWYYPPKYPKPTVTLVGSPNFGHRSVYRDLETQLYLVTLNETLQQSLHDEQSQLDQSCVPFTNFNFTHPSRTIPLWVRMVVLFFRNFF